MVTTNNLFVSIEEGFIKANKGLSVIFIILIAAINLLLVVKHVRKPNFYYSPKNMIIISLAIGDFLLAAFPLIVLAKRYFQTEEDQLSCSLFITYQTYKNYLIHFVYGVGLITLGAELIIRHRLKEVLYRPARAVAASCVPWFLGLVVVLPLCMSGVDYSNCLVWPYNRGMSIVSFALPAVVTVLLSFIILCIVFESQGFSGHVMLQSQGCGNTGPSIAVQNSSNQSQAGTQLQGMPYAGQSGQESNSNNNIVVVQQPQAQSGQVVGSSYKSQSDFGREKVRLLLVAIFYTLLVIPYHFWAFVLNNAMLDDFDKRFTILSPLSWVMVSRSLFTPMIMCWFLVRRRYAVVVSNTI